MSEQRDAGETWSARGAAGMEGVGTTGETANGIAGTADGTAGLAVLLGYLVAYLGNRVDADDLDVMSFSLHHLFCCADSLFRVTLSALATSLEPSLSEGKGNGGVDAGAGNVYRPLTWVRLQALKRILLRMQPLCQLLGEAGERLLASLSSPEQAGGAEAETEMANDAVSSEGMEQAVRDLAALLALWQQRYRNLPSLKTLLCELFPTTPLLTSPDAPFIQLLDSASILFGDILPAFQGVSTGDDEVVIMLLYDFLQQIDLLTIQFETLLELLNTLIAQYTLAVSSKVSG